MTLNWKREDIEKLIIQMQLHTCLYNIKSKDYLDRTKKALAMNEVLDEMKTTMSSITLEAIKKKWTNLRTQFGKEFRMINLSKKSGAGVSDVYVPKLWCFDQLSFLKTHTTMRKGQDNIEKLESAQESNLDEEIGTSEDEIEFKQLPNKRFKSPGNIKQLRNDLIKFRNNIAERKKEKKFAWLGTLVATQMDDINPDEQADAAWQVQCLMRKLVSKSGRNRNSSTSSSSTKDILEMSMDGVFDEDDFI